MSDSQALSIFMRRSDSRFEGQSYGARSNAMFYYVKRKLKNKRIGNLLRIRTFVTQQGIYRVFIFSPFHTPVEDDFDKKTEKFWLVKDGDVWSPFKGLYHSTKYISSLAHGPWYKASLLSNPYFVHHFGVPNVIPSPMFYFFDAQLSVISGHLHRARGQFMQTLRALTPKRKCDAFSRYAPHHLVRLCESYYLAAGMVMRGGHDDVDLDLASVYDFTLLLFNALSSLPLQSPSVVAAYTILRQMLDPTRAILAEDDILEGGLYGAKSDPVATFYWTFASLFAPQRSPIFDASKFVGCSSFLYDAGSPWLTLLHGIVCALGGEFRFSPVEFSKKGGIPCLDFQRLGTPHSGSVTVHYGSDRPLIVSHTKFMYTGSSKSVYLSPTYIPGGGFKFRTVHLSIYSGYPYCTVSPIAPCDLFYLGKYSVTAAYHSCSPLAGLNPARPNNMPCAPKCLDCGSLVPRESSIVPRYTKFGVYTGSNFNLTDYSIKFTEFSSSDPYSHTFSLHEGHRFKWGGSVGRFKFPIKSESMVAYLSRSLSFSKPSVLLDLSFFCYLCRKRVFLVSHSGPKVSYSSPLSWSVHLDHPVMFSHRPDRLFFLSPGSNWKRLLSNTYLGRYSPSKLRLDRFVHPRALLSYPSFDTPTIPFDSWESILARIAWKFFSLDCVPSPSIRICLRPTYTALLCVSRSVRDMIHC